MFIADYRIISTGAEPPLFCENDPNGVVTNRLAIAGMGIDKRFLISTYKINDDDCCLIRLFKRIYIWFRCVQIDVNGNPVLLKIGSLAKRLLLSEREIWDITKNGDLNEFIEKRAQEILGIARIHDTYNKMRAAYDVGPDGKLITKIGKNVTPLTLPTLEKVANFILDRGNFAEIVGEGKAVKIDDLIFLAKQEEGVNYIVLKTGAKSLGANASTVGTVEKVLSVADGTFALLKTIKNDANFKVNAERLQNEITLRDHIATSPGSSEGLQEPVLAKFDIIENDNIPAERTVAYLGKLYTEDLSTWVNGGHSEDDRMNCCQQLLNAFENMKAKNVRHLDIKPQNILVEKLGDRTLFKIADWDGARINTADEKVPINFIHTKQFITKIKYEALKKAENAKELHEIANKWDEFSLAVVCYYILRSGQHSVSKEEWFPFNTDEEGYLDPTQPNYKEFLQKRGLLDNLANVLDHIFKS